MKQSQEEKDLLDDIYEKKSKVTYDFNYISSAVNGQKAILGTVEADVSGRFGRWAKEDFRAQKLAQLSTQAISNGSILDVGGGNLLAASFFANKKFEVDVCDFGTSPYLSNDALKNSGIRDFIDGDFNSIEIHKKYDLIWTAHVLEHQLNVHQFLEKVVHLIKDDGFIALAVPPRKPFIVSGHINLFNPGLLLYRVILAGVDCSDAKIFQYDGNICLLVKVKKIKLPNLNYDLGDIEILKEYFPNSPTDGFNGDFMHCNLTENEIIEIYGNNANL